MKRTGSIILAILVTWTIVLLAAWAAVQWGWIR